MKPKDQMKTALLICALTSMSPAFANGTMVKADNLNRPTTSIQQQKKEQQDVLLTIKANLLSVLP